MSDKERLDEIKQKYSVLTQLWFGGQGVSNLEIRWLIQQAERTQKLEQNAQDLRDALGRRQEENARLREALEEIAKESGTPYARTAKAALEGGTEFYTNELWTKQVQHWRGQSDSNAPK